MKRTWIAYCIAGVLAIGGAAALAQSSAPPLRIVPMGETEKSAASKKVVPKKVAPKKMVVKKAPISASAAKGSVTKTGLSANATRTSASASATPTASQTAGTTTPAPKTKALTPARTASASTTQQARVPAATPTTKAPGAAPAPPRPKAPVTNAPPAALAVTNPSSAADWRPLDPENAIVYDTTKGRVIVELAPELAPGHVTRIKELVRDGFYNGIAFHRVIDTFMAQGGDPKGDGTGGSTKPNLRGEFNFRRGVDTGFVRAVDRGGAVLGWVRTVPVTSQPDILMDRTADKRVAAWANHCPGVTSMARSEDENSANSQFFLMRASYPTLDRRYTVWGRAVIGLDVIRSLKVGEPVVEPDRMLTVRMLADIPEADRPKVSIQRTDGPAFKARLAAALEERGAAFSNCDLAPEGRIIP